MHWRAAGKQERGRLRLNSGTRAEKPTKSLLIKEIKSDTTQQTIDFSSLFFVCVYFRFSLVETLHCLYNMSFYIFFCVIERFQHNCIEQMKEKKKNRK